ncbi:hypothetical protein GLOIN_2v1604363 [Rhizophagus clarus]|uniref:Ig-like domain-containing protein n=1 Tax=Rhizophagus clarus TaxID=94130 RepID=A0A8H3LHT6_9GLOM|nr:hypothetical protein GLOIN_2v1604363 [Rhizophagus clarus]
MSSKFYFVIFALVSLIFVGLTQSTPSIPLEKRFGGAGAVAYCDFKDKVTGRFTWTNIPGNKCRVTGQFNTGFDSPDVNEYSFFLEDDKGNKVNDLTNEITSQIHINPPGCSPFQCDFPFSLTSVKDVTGLCFVVKHKVNWNF